MAPYFGAEGQKAVWDKGVPYFTRGLHPGSPGSPRSPGTFRSTSSGNTCSPGDKGACGTGASGNVKNCFKGRKIIFHFRKKYFSGKNLLGRGYFGKLCAPCFPGYPGALSRATWRPVKKKNIAGGTGGQKTGPLFSRVPRGTLSVVNVALFFRKNIAGVFWRKKSGRNVVPWFSGKSQVHVCHETWIVLYFGKLKFTIFYSLLCYKTNNNNVVLYYKRESNIEHARRYNETREWFCRFR